MSLKSSKGKEESIEQLVKREVQEAWKDPAMLRSLADQLRDTVMAELRAALERNTAVIEKLEAALQERDKRIADLEVKLSEKQDDLEQYQRRQCLRIFGVMENSDEDTDTCAIHVARQIGVELTKADIDRSHRVGRAGASDKPRPIIVKFVSYRKRSEVFRNKKLLKNSGVTVREDLTKFRHTLLKQCISKYGVKQVWSIDGNIFVKQGDVKRRIMREADII